MLFCVGLCEGGEVRGGGAISVDDFVVIFPIVVCPCLMGHVTRLL